MTLNNQQHLAWLQFQEDEESKIVQRKDSCQTSITNISQTVHSIQQEHDQKEKIRKSQRYSKEMCNVRSRYLSRLQSLKLIEQQQKPKCRHVIIFDWDDTLFCTTQYKIQSQNHGSNIQHQFVRIDEEAFKCIQVAVQLGQVVIVTNSEDGWIDYCTQKYLPSTGQLLSNKKIKKISGRSLFQKKQNNPQNWKNQAFKIAIENIDRHRTLLNLISIGDSLYEVNAASNLTHTFFKFTIKTVRLISHPRVEQLVKQLMTITKNLPDVVASPKNINMRLSGRK